MGRPSIRVKLMITSIDDSRFLKPRTFNSIQMLHSQLVLHIGELEQLTIRSDSRHERDREKSITSSGKNQIQFKAS